MVSTTNVGTRTEVLKKLEEMRRKIADSDSDDESDSEDELELSPRSRSRRRFRFRRARHRREGLELGKGRRSPVAPRRPRRLRQRLLQHRRADTA